MYFRVTAQSFLSIFHIIQNKTELNYTSIHSANAQALLLPSTRDISPDYDPHYNQADLYTSTPFMFINTILSYGI